MSSQKGLFVAVAKKIVFVLINDAQRGWERVDQSTQQQQQQQQQCLTNSCNHAKPSFSYIKYPLPSIQKLVILTQIP